MASKNVPAVDVFEFFGAPVESLTDTVVKATATRKVTARELLTDRQKDALVQLILTDADVPVLFPLDRSEGISYTAADGGEAILKAGKKLASDVGKGHQYTVNLPVANANGSDYRPLPNGDIAVVLTHKGYKVTRERKAL